MTVFAVIAGGGTSGHVLPALAIAEQLEDRGHGIDTLVYMGARRGIETRLVPPTGLVHHFFDVDGLQRSLSVSALRRNVRFLPLLVSARREAVRIMRANRPSVVVSVGGYASLPAVLAAKKLRIPVVVVTYDRTAGRSSRFTSRFAAATATAFPDSKLPRAEWTGAPVRRGVRTIDRARDRDGARSRLGVPRDRFLVSVVGGSLGSLAVNDAVLELVRQSAGDRGLAVYHVSGERFLARVEASVASLPHGVDADGESGAWYRVVGYEDRMSDVYAASDVLIGRGGAGTVADVATTGLPSVLVPWSGAADDHQTANVRWLSDGGAAVLVSENSLPGGLVDAVRRLRDDRSTLSSMAENAHRIGEPNRRGAIAELVERVAGEVS